MPGFWNKLSRWFGINRQRQADAATNWREQLRKLRMIQLNQSEQSEPAVGRASPPRRKVAKMKASEIQIGQVYAVKVSGRVVPVRIVRDRGMGSATFGNRNKHLGWDGVSLKTHRTIRIYSAQRIRYSLPAVSLEEQLRNSPKAAENEKSWEKALPNHQRNRGDESMDWSLVTNNQGAD